MTWEEDGVLYKYCRLCGTCHRCDRDCTRVEEKTDLLDDEEQRHHDLFPFEERVGIPDPGA